jgi:hypothetical protein
MVGKLVRSEVAQQLLSDLVWKLHNRVKSSSLTYVIQPIESRMAHKTLRSAERAPTLSAGRKILVAAKAPHYRRTQSFGDMVLTDRGFARGEFAVRCNYMTP